MAARRTPRKPHRRERRLPVLQVPRQDVASSVLVVGAPERAGRAAELLDEVREVGRNREFVTFTGYRRDRRVTVCSHGVGSPGAAICFEELMRAGASTLIRAGTCGALVDELQEGCLLLPSGAVREEGTTPRLVPLAYPALAHRQVLAALETLLVGEGEPEPPVGVVLTTDTFYPSSFRDRIAARGTSRGYSHGGRQPDAGGARHE